MKKLLKVLSVSAILATTITAVSCGNHNTPSSNEPSETNEPSSSVTPSESGDSSSSSSSSSSSLAADEATYTIKAQSISGKPIANAIVSTTINGIEETFSSNEAGIITFNAKTNVNYVLEVIDPDGYEATEESKGLLAAPNETVTLEFTPYLIEDYEELPSKFSEYDQMYNYTFTGYESSEGGKTFKGNITKSIKGELEDHDLVILNFWYTTCSWCVREFPSLMESYKKYSDKISLIEINPGSSSNDTVATVQSFLAENKYDFFTTIDDYTLISTFALTGYPTTVFIDRYGTITSIEGGAITSVDKWEALFSSYIGTDYEQKYESSTSTVLPTTTFPGSETLANIALAGEDIKKVSTFTTETRDNYKTYNWPWVVNGDTISPSNKGVNSSYSIVYLDVTVPANKALTLDYKASTEDGDLFGVYVDGKLMFQDAGNNTDFTTKCVYVAGDVAESITLEFVYYKDSKLSLYDDTVYIKNIKFVDTDTIGSFRQIRQASYGELDPIDKTWGHYVEAVYNAEDGYYHKGSANGPLLLAALSDTNTHFANSSVAEMLASSFTDDLKKATDTLTGKTYYSILSSYASYCNNSSVTMMDLPTEGLTSITSELYRALVWLGTEFGDEAVKDNKDQWLELCVYIDEYNVADADKLGDPIKGLATFSAIEAKTNVLSTDTNENYIKFDFPLVPRGYFFKVTPTQSGVYRVYGIDEGGITECFFYDEEGNPVSGLTERSAYKNISGDNDDENFSYHFYYEAGKTYYVAPCWWDINNTTDTLHFRIDYVGSSYKYLAQASEGTFTYDSDSSGNISQYVSVSNVDVKLGEDKYYHPVVNNVIQENQYIYADFEYVTAIINSMNLTEATNEGAFDFTLETLQKLFIHYQTDSEGNFVYDANGEPLGTAYTEDELSQIFCMEDKTERVKAIIAANKVTDKNSIYYGTIKVDEELYSLLTQLVAKYTFINTRTESGATIYTPVDGAWLKVCYYEVDLANSSN